MEVKLIPIGLSPVQISIDKLTGMLELKQGQNKVKLTRDDVFNMGKLYQGKFDANGFTSSVISHQHFAVDPDGIITISCQDEYENTTVFVKKHRKTHDLERIQEFVNHNKGRIAWDRDFRGRR